MPTKDTLAYYSSPGPLTTAGPRLTELPAKLPDLLTAVQGLLIHEPGHPESTTGHLRATSQILDHILATDPRPLTEPRPPHHRLTGSCRHFTLLTVAALRAHGIPARARCGFARYFTPGRHGDHWLTEYWNPATARWTFADSQLSPALSRTLGIAFPSEDVPGDQFVAAGNAWQNCRRGKLDPSRCGLEGEGQSGWWWIAGNLIRDTAALSKVELLPWDMWAPMPGPTDPIAPTLAMRLDHLAARTADPRPDEFPTPAHVHNFIRQADEPVPSGRL